jgi:hypothetical protein
VQEVWSHLARLAKHDFGDLPEQQLLDHYKPGTEKRKLRRLRHSPDVDDQAAADVVFVAPKRSESSVRNDKPLVKKRLSTYDPFALLQFDSAFLDYKAVFETFERAPRTVTSRGTVLKDTYGYKLVSMRSFEQQRRNRLQQTFFSRWRERVRLRQLQRVFLARWRDFVQVKKRARLAQLPIPPPSNRKRLAQKNKKISCV